MKSMMGKVCIGLGVFGYFGLGAVGLFPMWQTARELVAWLSVYALADWVWWLLGWFFFYLTIPVLALVTTWKLWPLSLWMWLAGIGFAILGGIGVMLLGAAQAEQFAALKKRAEE